MTAVKIPAPRKLAEFGITREQYLELYGDGHCPVCSKPYGYGPRAPAIDHDHKTFETRGVICSACNYWLGLNHDDAEKLQRAAAYLILPPTYDWKPVPRIADAPPRQGE